MPKKEPVKKSAPKRVRNVRSRRTESDPIAAAVERMYNKSAPLLVCEGLLFGIAAIWMFINPVAILNVLTFVIGIGLILFGLYRTISGFIVSRNIGGGWIDVIFGMVNIALGVVFCVYPTGSIIGLTLIFVVLFLFKALRALVFAINMARARFGHWVIDLIIAVALVALAVALLFWPLAAPIAVVYYLAITLLLYAASDIYMYIELLKLKRNVLS